MNGNRASSKLVIGSAFDSIGQVRNHSDLPQKTLFFRKGRNERLGSIIKSIEKKQIIANAKSEAPFLVGRYFVPNYDGSEFAQLQQIEFGGRKN